MTLKDIKQKFIVHPYTRVNTPEGQFPNERKGQYLLLKKEQETTGRSVHKYLCLINKKGLSFSVEGFKSTTKLEILEQQVSEYVKALPYDSDYYNPQYRPGLTEELIIHDYLLSIGFEKPFYAEAFWYTLKDKNIYGFKSSDITISLSGMDVWDKPRNGAKDLRYNVQEKISINLHGETGGWMEIPVKREVEDMKKAIDTLLKPLLVSDSIRSFEKSEKMINFSTDVDIYLKNIAGNLSMLSVNYKATLKEKLMEMAATL